MKTSLLKRRAKGSPSRWSFVTALAAFLLAGPMPLAAHSGHTDWGPWSFDWEVKDGAAIGLRNVYYKGELVIYKANMPVIRVRYVGGTTYGDRINWGDLQTEVTLCDGNRFGCGSKVCQRSYTVNGRSWLEIGVFAMLGEYRLYPAWQLSEDGYIQPRLWSAGLQLYQNHLHHPYWRVDFDIKDAANDQVFVYDSNRPNEGWGPGWHKYPSELNDVKNPSTSRQWYVRDNLTGHGVWILPGSNDGVADGFSSFDVAPRLYHFPLEMVPWPGVYPNDVGELQGNNGENIAEKDVVLWYVSHLFHDWGDMGCNWHYTGPTFKVQR
jgi:hypothetical protein